MINLNTKFIDSLILNSDNDYIMADLKISKTICAAILTICQKGSLMYDIQFEKNRKLEQYIKSIKEESNGRSKK